MLHSYVGIIINHYNHPYSTTTVMESKRISWLKLKTTLHPKDRKTKGCFIRTCLVSLSPSHNQHKCQWSNKASVIFAPHRHHHVVTCTVWSYMYDNLWIVIHVINYNNIYAYNTHIYIYIYCIFMDIYIYTYIHIRYDYSVYIYICTVYK